LLSKLVSSKVYRQLEFQAVGNWWVYDVDGLLKRLPTGREDISQDRSIDNRTKRNLMKFLKFVVDYDNQTELWSLQGNDGLSGYLSSQFQLPVELQTVMAALTLSLEPPDRITVKWALPRIATHLTSIGVFGPGFGAVIPKWGGGAEISQVACRAGAVGGGVYVLGIGVTDSSKSIENGDVTYITQLSNGEVVRSTHLVQTPTLSHGITAVSKILAVISSPLASLFRNSIEGSPMAAVTVITIPSNTIIVNSFQQSHPIYIMLHSSETGECPLGQSKYFLSLLLFFNSITR
jgi:RAB protein geranylgeranyltransferase component A